MKYRIHSFRHAEIILENEPSYNSVWNELLLAIESIKDIEIIEHHQNNPRLAKSISESINNLLDFLQNLFYNLHTSIKINKPTNKIYS